MLYGIHLGTIEQMSVDADLIWFGVHGNENRKSSNYMGESLGIS